MYYVITKTFATVVLLKSDIELGVLQEIFAAFYKDTVCVKHSILPQDFVNTLTFNNNMYTCPKYHLEYKFCQWLYNVILQRSSTIYKQFMQRFNLEKLGLIQLLNNNFRSKDLISKCAYINTTLGSNVDLIYKPNTILGSNEDLIHKYNTTLGSNEDLIHKFNTTLGSNADLIYKPNTILGSNADLIYKPNIILGSNEDLIHKFNTILGSNTDLIYKSNTTLGSNEDLDFLKLNSNMISLASSNTILGSNVMVFTQSNVFNQATNNVEPFSKPDKYAFIEGTSNLNPIITDVCKDSFSQSNILLPQGAAVKEIALAEVTDVQGYNFCPYSYEDLYAKYIFDDKEVPNTTTEHINENALVLLIYDRHLSGTSWTILSSKHIDILKKLEQICINDICIKSIFVFPNLKSIPGLIAHFNLHTYYGKPEFWQNIYILYKIVNEKPQKGEMIKAIADFVFSHYETDLTESIPLQDMMNAFRDSKVMQCTPLNVMIDAEVFLKTLKFFNIQIKKGRVMYFKKGTSNIAFFNDGNQYVTSSIANKKNHQLRMEPNLLHHHKPNLFKFPFMKSSHLEYDLVRKKVI